MYKNAFKIINKKRTKLNISKEDLAKKLDVSLSTYSKWESKNDIPEDKALLLCKILKISKNRIINPYDDIKLNIATKLSIAVSITIIAVLLICVIVGYYNMDFATSFWLKIYNPFFDLFFYLSQNISLSIILFIIMILVAILEEIIKPKKRKIKNKTLIINILHIIDIISLTLIFMTIIIMYSCFNNPNLNYYLNNPNVNKEYKEEDLEKLYSFLNDKVYEYADKVERVDGKIILDNPVELAVSDLKNSSNILPFLKGIYPAKLRSSDNLGFLDDYYTVTGVTYHVFGTIYIDYTQSTPYLLNTLEHELCHSKGVLRENETVYCSIITGLNSSNTISIYSAYLEAFLRVNTVMADVNNDLYETTINNINKLCIDKNYDEMCNINAKEVDNYKNDTDTLFIKTYALKEYNNIDLISIINKLKEVDPDIKLTISDEPVDLDNIQEYISSNSTKKLMLVMKNSKEIYSKIKDILKENKNNLFGIKQVNLDSYLKAEEDIKEITLEDALKPFDNKSTLFTQFNSDYTFEHDYDKATRLFLEYFDLK